MRTALLAALLAGVVAATAVPANAAPAQYAGGCEYGNFEPSPQLAGGDQYVGTLYYVIALYDSADPADNPVSADVSCEIRVNGVAVAGTPVQHVTVAGAGATNVMFAAGSDDTIELCTVVASWSDGSPDTRDCPPATTIQLPPQEIVDIVNAVFEEAVDPALCPALASLSPGVPGVVDVNAQGDVLLAGEPFWDCPPYDLFG